MIYNLIVGDNMKKAKSFLIILVEAITLLFSYDFLYKKGLTFYSLANPFGGSLIVGLILSFINKDKLNDLSKQKRALVIIFTIFMIVGEIIDVTSNLAYLFKFTYLLLTVVKAIGYYHIFTSVLKYVDYLVNKKHEFKASKGLIKRYEESLSEHPFKTSFISVFLVITFFMIAFYPIVLSPDPAFQIKMYLNVPTKYIYWVIQRDPNVFMTNHHPILQTYLLGWALDIGRTLNNANFGLFLYTLTQSIIYSTCLAFTIKFLKHHNVNSKYLLIVTLIYMLVPMYPFYSVSAVKDTYYTVFFIYFVLFLYDLIMSKERTLKWKYVILLFIICLFLCLFRQNGIYIILLLFPVICWYSMNNIKRLSLVFFSLLIFLWGFNNILIPSLGISDGSIREALSVPFQQTARLVKYHSEIISDEDLEVIDKLLNLDNMAKRYDRDLSDPVKNQFNKNATSEDLKAYFKVWFKYLLKEPMCYINATLNNTSGYYYPYKLKWYFYHNYDSRIAEGEKAVNYHYNKLGIIRTSLSNYAIIYPYIPVIGLLSNIGFGLFSVLYLIAHLIEKRNKEFIIVLLPLVISILVCFVGPANTYFRYAMPYLFVLPTLEILFKKENEV